jgi:transposase
MDISAEPAPAGQPCAQMSGHAARADTLLSPVFSELLRHVGNDYSSLLLLQSAQRLIDIAEGCHRQTAIRDSPARPGYFSRNVASALRSNPWAIACWEQSRMTHCATMTRSSGRAPRGQRMVDAVPFGHWLTTAFVAGLRGEIFKAYVEQMLAPALSPGDVVARDNLAAYKVAGVEEAIRAVGAGLLYLPPYCPDLNRIEQLFSKLKALLRKAGTRTNEVLWTTISELLDQFSPRSAGTASGTVVRRQSKLDPL